MSNLAQKVNRLALVVKKLVSGLFNTKFKGVHTSLIALQTAYPSASAGDYATLDAGTGNSARLAIWDENDTTWVDIGEVSLATSDMVIEGNENLYFKNNRVKSAFVREDITFSATALANDATSTNTVNIASRYQLLHITTSHACRVRLYSATAKRDADLTRAIGTDPEGNHGLMFEFISTSNLLSADLSPVVDGFSDTAAIAYSITNLSGATQTISVTLNHVKTGA